MARKVKSGTYVDFVDWVVVSGNLSHAKTAKRAKGEEKENTDYE